jgi:hypothetical protein
VLTLLVDQAAGGYAAPIPAMTAWDGALWIGRWDGSGRSMPSHGGPSQATGVRALAVWGNALYVGLDNSASAHAVQKVGPAYRAAATLETPAQDAGLPDLAKALASVTVQHAPLAAGESIEAQYRLEDSGG